jgi:hypothetical protein
MEVLGPCGGEFQHASDLGNQPAAMDQMDVVPLETVMPGSCGPEGSLDSVATEGIGEGEKARSVGQSKVSQGGARIYKARQKPSASKSTTKGPPTDMTKHFQALAGGVERVIEQQAQSQQQERRGELELMWDRFNEELKTRDEKIQRLESSYQARIEALETEVKRLRGVLSPAQERSDAGNPREQRETPKQQRSEATARGHTEQPRIPRTPAVATQVTEQLQNGMADTSAGRRKATYADMVAVPKRAGGEWQMVTARNSKNRSSKKVRELTPAKGLDKDSRKLIFRREGVDAPRADKADVILALNKMFHEKGFPNFARVVDAGYTTTGAIVVVLGEGTLNRILIEDYQDLLLTAVRRADSAVIAVEKPERWYRVKVHGVPVGRYMSLGLGLARQEIETGSEWKLMRNPEWLRNPDVLMGSAQRGSSIVITLGSLEEARKIRSNGIRFGGQWYKTEHYWELGPDTTCPRCCGIGHRSFRECGDRPVKCFICAGPHEGYEHVCRVRDCTAKPGVACQHMPAKCGNCERNHPATAEGCPKKRQVRKQAARRREDSQPSGDAEASDTSETEAALAAQIADSMNSSQASSDCEDESFMDASRAEIQW